MEAEEILIGAMLCAGMSGASLAAALRAGWINAARRERGGVVMSNHILTRGITSFRPFAGVLLRNKAIAQAADDATTLLGNKGWKTDEEAVVSLALTASLLVMGVCFMVFGSMVIGAVAAAAVFVGSGILCRSRRAKIQAGLQEDIPGIIKSMNRCFQAGMTLQQTCDALTEETTGRMRTIFAQTSSMLQTGTSAKDALAHMQKSSGIAEMVFVAVALDIQHQTGGSITAVLDAAQATVRERIALKKSLQVQTAQARLSARVVTAMPFILLIVLSFISEGFVDAFFESTLGVVLLIVALGLQLGGIFIIRAMLKVDGA